MPEIHKLNLFEEQGPHVWTGSEWVSLENVYAERDRYRQALERIAEADEAAHPHVKIALEALHPMNYPTNRHTAFYGRLIPES